MSNGLSPAEDERLAILLEELGEAIQVIGKIKRHGYESTDPTKPASPTNRRLLEKELGDIQAAVLLLVACDELDDKRIARRVPSKLDRLARYHHHQHEALRKCDEALSKRDPGAHAREVLSPGV